MMCSFIRHCDLEPHIEHVVCAAGFERLGTALTSSQINPNWLTEASVGMVGNWDRPYDYQGPLV